MERMGLVSRVEAELERMISLEQLPADGSLPSEQSLSRNYGVSRATVREALLRLSARGLVVQHPGRRTRAVALDEAMTLENLSVALHGAGKAHPDRWRLLEGYLALKRETTVELLVACCERASERELARLGDACFALMEAARWKERGEWAQQEFALLRLAARAADRPGHLLLIQSLERSFWAMAERVLPHLDSRAAHSWAKCAFNALGEKDTQALRQELPPLLQACDARLFGGLAPASQAVGTCEAHTTQDMPHHGGPSAPEPLREEPLPDAAASNLSGCLTGLRHSPPTGEPQPELPSRASCPEPEDATSGAGSSASHEEKWEANTHSPPSPPLSCAPCAAFPSERCPGLAEPGCAKPFE